MIYVVLRNNYMSEKKDTSKVIKIRKEEIQITKVNYPINSPKSMNISIKKKL